MLDRLDMEHHPLPQRFPPRALVCVSRGASVLVSIRVRIRVLVCVYFCGGVCV